MKKFCTFALMALICFSQFAFAAEWVKGDEWVLSVEKEYLDGKYDALLTEHEAWFAKQKEESLIDEASLFPEMKGRFEEQNEKLKPIQERLSAGYQEQVDKLLEAVSDEPPCLIREIVVAFYGEEKQVNETAPDALSTIEMLKWQKNPAFTSSFAQKVEEVLRESFIKKTACLRRGGSDEISQEDAELLCYLNEIEKMHALSALCDEQVCDDEQDRLLCQLIRDSKEGYRFLAASMHNFGYLRALEKNERAPANECEAKVAEVLRVTNEEISVIWAEYFELLNVGQ